MDQGPQDKQSLLTSLLIGKIQRCYVAKMRTGIFVSGQGLPTERCWGNSVDSTGGWDSFYESLGAYCIGFYIWSTSPDLILTKLLLQHDLYHSQETI